VIQNLTLFGRQAELLCGIRPAVKLSAWTIRKQADGKWTLVGRTTFVDSFLASRRPLLFSAPREARVKGVVEQGRWAWVVLDLKVQTGRGIVAELGQPEQ
jgi:hypothetical protein